MGTKAEELIALRNRAMQTNDWRAFDLFAAIHSVPIVESLLKIIETHNLCHDLHGKVGQKEFEIGCKREVIKVFGSCSWLNRLRAAMERIPCTCDDDSCGVCEIFQLIEEYE